MTSARIQMSLMSSHR